MDKDQTFYTRKFLNSEERGGTAFIEASVRQISENKESCDAGLKVGDCNRVVELDFGCWSKEDIATVRQKITTFRRAIIAFDAVLISQLDEMEAAQ